MRPSTLEKEQRKRDTARLFNLGITNEQEIARRLGVSRQAVGRYVKELRREWAEERRIDRDEWIDRELALLAALQEPFVADALKGKGFAMDRVLALMDRRAKYLGLDAPTRIDVGRAIRERAAELAEEHDLSTADVMAEMEAILEAGREQQQERQRA
jgi:transcriptional regulator with XRE-family HTH domain